MNKTLIFGHKNPDTDTICSAIAYSMIKEKLNEVTEAVRLGSISEETQFILDYLNLDAPRLVEKLDGENVILVDHNEFGQSCDGIESANILEVVDHHRVANFQTSDPLYMNVQPVGCTATIVCEIAMNNNVEIDETLATLLLSAIISDTLLFKSPTCTKKDVDTAAKLNEIVAFDMFEYGMDLLKAGTNLSKYSALELLNIDSKGFDTPNGLFQVSQVNTVDINEFLAEFEVSIKQEMENQITSNDYDMFILMVTDIIHSNSLAIVLGNKADIFETNFKTKLENNQVMLDGVVSRKKQIVPFL